jgi:hypothetical protein
VCLCIHKHLVLSEDAMCVCVCVCVYITKKHLVLSKKGDGFFRILVLAQIQDRVQLQFLCVWGRGAGGGFGGWDVVCVRVSNAYVRPCVCVCVCDLCVCHMGHTQTYVPHPHTSHAHTSTGRKQQTSETETNINPKP